MSIKAVIWDFGGVLVRTEDSAPRSALAAQLGLSPAAIEALVFDHEQRAAAQLGQVDGDAYLAAVAAQLRIEPETLVQGMFSGDRLDEELMDYIRSLRPAYKLGLLSNAMSNLRRLLQETYPIHDAFDALIISAEVGLAKPDPRIYQQAMEALVVRSDEAVFIDDFVENVAGARDVGLHAIHFQSRDQALDELNVLLAA